MKKRIIAILFIILSSLSVATQVFALTKEQLDARHAAVLAACPGTGTNPAISDCITLQVGIPMPNCPATSPDFVCLNGQVIGVKDATALIAALFQFGVILGAIVMVTIMVIGGGQYMLSAGVSEKAFAGTEKIKNGFYGLVVLIFSVVILYQIDPRLTKLTLTPAETIEAKKLITVCPDAMQNECGKPFGPAEQSCTGIKCSDPKQYCQDKQGLVDLKDSKGVAILDEKGVPKQTTQRVFGPCVARKLDWEPCTSGEECLSGSCFKQKCEMSVAGQDCKTSADCLGLICETNNGNGCSYGLTGNDCSSDRECSQKDGVKCIVGGWIIDPKRNFCVNSNTAFAHCDNDSQCPSGYGCGKLGVFDTLETAYPNPQGETSYEICMPKVTLQAGTKPLPLIKCAGDGACKTGLNKILTFSCGAAIDCLAIQGAYKTLALDPNSLKCNTIDNYCTVGGVGSSCNNNSECASGKCDTFGVNVCTNGLVGEGCDKDEECATGNTCKKNFCQLNY